jgi:hypothetical protein
MGDDYRMRIWLDIVSSLLLRCVILGLALLLLWFLLFMAMKDTTYVIHSNLFSISKTDFERVNYYGMAMVKGVVLVGFLIPYVATRLVLRSLRGRPGLPVEERESSDGSKAM